MRERGTTGRRLLAALAAASLLSGADRRADRWRTSGTAAHRWRRVESAPGSARAARERAVPGGKATIRSTVSLVEIDVQVTNRDGKPMKGLTQEQFTVTEDGKPQKISTFEYNDIERVETAGKGRRSADHRAARNRDFARGNQGRGARSPDDRDVL